MKFGTKVIHSGVKPDPSTGAIMTPIFQTSTYVQNAPGDHKGYEYARSQNPTRTVLENNLAALECGSMALCYGSGLAAIDAILKLLSPGDELISTSDLYGGTYRIMVQVFAKYDIKFHFVGMDSILKIAEKINENTKMIWVETPTNPMLNIIDIEAVSKLAQSKGIMTVVDNTFATPYLQNPLKLGADVVMHSATKYLGGHSDVVHGALIVKDLEVGKKLQFIQKAVGAVPGPQDCFLILRGIKTLHIRVQRACENARKVADYLKTQNKIANVYYPGLTDHPNHDLAKRQMKDFGGMVSFDLVEDTIESATKVLAGTHYFALAESLGGVESLIGHPASMTHGSIPREDRLAVGITDSLIRLSVGIEDIEDLIEDLDKALKNL